jgi:nicotinate-nucleotide--dimethylbenzimidazole phosphoribosyltransferase
VSAAADARRRYDAKTKPRGSLGRLEELGVRIAGIRGVVPDRLRAVIVVAAGDHGVTAERTSAYPQEVTRQMVANFVAGGAAVNVLAREAGADVVVVDAGIAVPLESDAVRRVRIGAGTANLATGPAMTPVQLEDALAAGRAFAGELEPYDVVGLGEMGIGNTTAASALVAALLRVDPAAVCGPGTGLDAAGIARKIDVVARALAVNAGADPLAALGGFEIAFLAGLASGCAARGIVVLLDGFITGAAALAAVERDPRVRDVLVASHRSPEPGHALVLEALGLAPLLDLGLRLGEGSGAALALPLLHASIAVLRDMATFESAGVTDAGR